MTKPQFTTLLSLGALIALVLLVSTGKWVPLGEVESTIVAPWLRLPAFVAFVLFSYPFCSLLYPSWSRIDSTALRGFLFIPLAIILALLSLGLPVVAVVILSALAQSKP
jgi:hypothetical protein